jgi:hypothetical protein
MRSSFFLLMALTIVILPVKACAQVTDRCAALEVSSALRSIASLDPGTEKYEKAEDLAVRLIEVGPGCLSDSDVELLSLQLRDDDDWVRSWAAGLLGDAGDAGRVALPALERALAERPCEDKRMASAAAIRLAIRRLGENPSKAVPTYCRDPIIDVPIPARPVPLTPPDR